MSTTTTKVIGSGGDYTTIAAWEAAAPADLTTSIAGGEIWRGECKDQAFDEDVTLSGSTTDATGYKHLTCQSGAFSFGRHNIFSNTPMGARIVRTGTRTAGTAIVLISEQFGRVEGLSVTFTGTAAGSGVCAILRANVSNAYLLRNYVYHTATLAPTTYGIHVDANFDNIVIANNIVRKMTGSTAGWGIYVKTGFGAGPRTYHIYNNTVTGSSHVGMYMEQGTASTIIVRNNLSMLNGGNDFTFDGSGHNSDHNMSEDATADDSSADGGNSLVSQSPAATFFSIMDLSTRPSFNLHLRLGSPAIGAGEDLGSNLAYATDIDGLDRDGAAVTWDIGADQRVAPTTTTKTVKASGGDYTTIDAAVNAIPADLFVSGEVWKIVIDAGTYNPAYTPGDTAAVWVQDGTIYTDFEHYIWVTAAAGSEHNGIPGAGVVIDVTANVGSGDDMTHWGAPYTVVEWLEITYSGSTAHGGGSSSGAKTNSHHIRYRWLMAHDIDHSANTVGLSANACADALIENCMAWTINGGNTSFGEICGIKLDPGGVAGYPSKILNCTVWDIGNASESAASGWGYRMTGGSGEMEIRNSISMDCLTLDFQYGGGPTITSSNNLSSDATADDNHTNDGNGATHLINKTTSAQFVSISGSIDLHLKAGADAIGTGTDLGTLAAIDIDGFDRDAGGVVWDIGADQFQGGGSGTIDLAGFGVATGAGSANLSVTTSAYPVQGVVINDIDVGTLGFKVVGLSGFTEPPEEEYLEQSGDEEVSGSIVLERRTQKRECSISLYRKDFPAVIAAAVEQLHDLLLDERPARITLDTSVTRLLYAELRRAPFVPRGAYFHDFAGRVWTGSLEFICPDPWFYDILPTNLLGVRTTPVELALGNGPVQPDLLIVGPATNPSVDLYDWQDNLVGQLTFGASSLASGEYLAIRCRRGQQSMYRNSTGAFGSGTPAHSERTAGSFLTVKREYSRFRTGQFAKIACPGVTGAGELRVTYNRSWGIG